MPSHPEFALVTGGSRGIGRAIALALAERGSKVAIHYHTRADAAAQVLAEVRARGADGFMVSADVTREDDLRRMIDRVGAEFGALDVLVSNARPELAAFYQAPLELSRDAWKAALDSQATALLVAVQAATTSLRDGGRVIAITYSPSTRYGSWQPWTAMGTAKAALETLVRYFAVALGPRGVTVNCVSPGFVLGQAGTLDATVINSLPAEAQQAIKSWHESGWTPMRRLATPSDVANAVALLCAPEAGFITGQTLHVDGGASLMDAFAPLQLQGIREA
jgi:enoyl-[acyl-carrier protein] reductase III